MRGFTLIEVLVALAIVAVALGAAVRVAGSMTQANVDLRLKLLAQLAADNRIAELRAAAAFPPIGTRSTPCPQGKARLDCVEEVKSTPNPLFRRVEVRVYANSEHTRMLVEMVGILPRP
ncbi:MAG TPA: type II secretion system minor pseudopilin GspI [Burkholderiales bacterium]|nr:type II secretion system minor pseudopilin GspI [Burkholderiales bacterium]